MGVEGVSADVARRRWRGVPVRGGAAPERPPEDGEDIAKGKGKRVHTPSGSFPVRFVPLREFTSLVRARLLRAAHAARAPFCTARSYHRHHGSFMSPSFLALFERIKEQRCIQINFLFWRMARIQNS